MSHAGLEQRCQSEVSILGRRNVHKGLVVADHNSKLYTTCAYKCRPPLEHAVTQHQHERKEEDGTGKCEEATFFMFFFSNNRTGSLET